MNALARALGTAAVAAGPLAAQVATSPPLGAEVRLEMRDGTRVVGTVAAHADATTSADIMIPATFFAVSAALVATGLGAGVGALAAPRRWTTPVAIGAGAGGTRFETLRVGIAVSF